MSSPLADVKGCGVSRSVPPGLHATNWSLEISKLPLEAVGSLQLGAPIVEIGGGLETFDRAATFDGMVAGEPLADVSLDGYTEDGLVVSFPARNGALYPPCPTTSPSACPSFPGFSGGFLHPSSAESGVFVGIRAADGRPIRGLQLNFGSFLMDDPDAHIRWEAFVDDGLLASGVLSAVRGSVLVFQDEAGFEELRVAAFPDLAMARQGFEANGAPGSLAIDNVRAWVAFECEDGIDNDGDGSIDFPQDSSCTGADDPTEDTDQDGDLISDFRDNCLAVTNPTQADTDRDGYGNACDADYTNDGAVGIADFNVLRAQFGLADADPRFDPAVDTNGDGAIGNPEFNLLRGTFGGPPGPSGLVCAGTVPCP